MLTVVPVTRRSATLVVLVASALVTFACGPSKQGGSDASGMGAADAADGAVQPDSTGGGQAGVDGGNGETVFVYAHSASTLYRIDPTTLSVTMVAPFNWGAVGTDTMTDLAIDKNGQMIGVSYTRVYRVDPSTAVTTLLSSQLARTFNGLSFVPADQLGLTGDDVLVGSQGADGTVFRVDPMTGAVTAVGNMGAFISSGDLVGVAGFGTVQTVYGTSGDVLARLAPSTFSASPAGNSTGYPKVYGLAFFKNKVYGFTEGGAFILIDPLTGAATTVANTGIAWWGAAVTTIAPVVQLE